MRAVKRRSPYTLAHGTQSSYAGQIPEGADGRVVFPFDMQSRPFPGDDPFAPPREPPTRANIEGGCFGVDEVPFYEVQEIELPEGK